MAVRIDATGEHYNRTTGSFPTNGIMTTTFWCALDVARVGANAALWSTQGYWALYNENGDGSTMALERSSVVLPGSVTMSVGAWYFFAVARAGTGASQTVWYYGTPGSSLTTNTYTSTTTNFTPSQEHIGTNVFNAAAGWFNGRIAAFKQWSAGLSLAEIEQERGCYVPIRSANLFEWYPFLEGGATTQARADLSGNGRTLAVGTNSATADGPPIVWQPARRRIVAPASAPPGGLSIPVAQHYYHRRRVA